MPVLGAVFAAVALPHNAADGTRRSDDIDADVWQPASDGPVADTRDPDNSADSSAVAEKRTRTPCEDKPGDTDGALDWLRQAGRKYAALVPWEVVLPWGPPGRFVISLSGIFIDSWATFADITTLPTKVTDPRPRRHPSKRNRQDAKKTKKETVRVSF